MGFYVWKDAFQTGVEEADRQHRGFLDLLNDCHGKVERSASGVLDAQTAETLRRYAATHFRFEEALMRSVGYPGLALQEKQHAFFESEVGHLDDPHAPATGKRAEEVLSFLRDWLLQHILDEDRKGLAYYADHATKKAPRST